MKRDAKILECLVCFERYSRDDIESGLYRLETMVCSRCYAKMQKLPHSRNCFGKPTTILPNGKRLLGYDPADAECRDVCPDRAVCRLVVWSDEDDRV